MIGLEARDLTFAYNADHPLVRNFSFQLERGSCVGVSGRSGSGKSTLARLLSGHIRPQSGQVLLEGQDMTGRPNRRVLLVPQENDLFPWLPVARQIAFGMVDSDTSKVEALMKLTKLESFPRHFPHELSGGMKKRLSLARALAVEPEVLILDETFSALDFDLRLELFADLERIRRETGVSLLVISHDPRDLERVAERVLNWPPK